MPTRDEKLLVSEDPQQQVDRMGNGWVLEGQYEKQLLLPVHMIADGPPQLREVERDGHAVTVAVYMTRCGLDLGGVVLRSTDDPDDVTCKACAKG